MEVAAFRDGAADGADGAAHDSGVGCKGDGQMPFYCLFGFIILVTFLFANLSGSFHTFSL